MELNQTIVRLISILTNGGKKADRFLSLSDKSASLKINKESLVDVNEESILLLGKEDISQKLFPVSQTKVSFSVDFDKLEKFCSEIDIVRLNHLGISYPCNADDEIAYFKAILEGTAFKLYEEKSDSPDYRWFFIGNKENREYPLFELVMNKHEAASSLKEWIPHFQIDIGTNEDIAKLKSLANKYLSPDFFKWELNIPKLGTVLAMGRLANIDGTKIYLGLGTDKCDTKLHREEILRLV